MGIELDATFWAFVALVLFFGLMIYLGVPGKVAAALDTRAKEISNELDQAQRLREEAQELLAKYQRKQLEATREAEEIVALAKENAERFVEETREKMHEQIERRTRQAEEKIAQAERQAEAEVRNVSVEIAVAAAGALIARELDAPAHESLIDQAIDSVDGAASAGANPSKAA